MGDYEGFLVREVVIDVGDYLYGHVGFTCTGWTHDYG